MEGKYFPPSILHILLRTGNSRFIISTVIFSTSAGREGVFCGLKVCCP
jgi:hypothetical protein